MPVLRKALAAVLCAAALLSCSTTRVLEQGQYRLARNAVKVTNDDSFNASQLSAYLRQQPNSYFLFGWNPFLNIYNWSDGSDRFLSRLARKIGEAPVVYDPELVELSENNIRDHLEYLGYYGSEVGSNIRTQGRRVLVDYMVTLGRRFRIDSIRFDLPADDVFAREFLADSAAMTVRPGDFLSEQTLEAESARSAAMFRKLGYYNFSKNHYSFVADTISVPGKLLLDYQISTGMRGRQGEGDRIAKYTIGDVAITHARSLPFREKILRSLNTIRPGDLYNEETVSNTYSRLSALKVFSSVGIEMNRREGENDIVDCNIRLSQSRPQGFKADLEASSNSSGLIGISPQLSYYHKNIFHGGEWLNIALVGNFQFRPSDDVHSNEFGISTGLSLPKFLGIPYKFFKGPSIPRTEFNASFNYQSRPEYTRNILAFSYGYTGVYKKNLSYQLYPVQLNFVRLYDLDSDFSKTLDKNPFMRYSYQDHFDAGAGGVFYYTTNSDIVPKTSFHFARLAFDLSGNVVSLFRKGMKVNDDGKYLIWGAPFSQYVKGELSLGRTIRFGRRDKMALAGRFLAGAGYAYGNSTALPFEKQFYSGGAGSLRGWQARAVGPGYSGMNKSFSIPSQTGDVKLEANLEYRFSLFWKLEGALFAECGNVWSLQYDDPESRFNIKDFYNSLAADWGFGLRVNLDFILLRLDLGVKSHDPSRAKGERWIAPSEWTKADNLALHFGVGYPF